MDSILATLASNRAKLILSMGNYSEFFVSSLPGSRLPNPRGEIMRPHALGGLLGCGKGGPSFNPINIVLVMDTVISRTNVKDRRTLNKGLPLRENLARKGFQIPTICLHGCDDPESEDQIFNECLFAKRFWFASRLNIRVEDIGGQSMTDWINSSMANRNAGNQSQQTKFFTLLLTIC
ncbi:ribonuclease H [Senna tora]|uniref:Ribonuclease H n=1 Tax=Senna tora TaxID=362788 RepID=A0A834X9M4_9FABA|nr:ribonuclease H [Senna tora]